MVARSDLFIMVVSASLLAVGIYRWQNNLDGRPDSGISERAALSRVPVQSPPLDASGDAVIGQVSRQYKSSSDGSDMPTGSTVGTFGTIGTANSTGRSAMPAGTISDAGFQAVKPNEPLYGTYTVKPGDYLGRIAQEYGTTVARLQEINGITGHLIEVDQTLKYPLPAN